jgi:shikimate dehydrogenase
MSASSPPLAGVMGWPIGHSKSPRLHGHWLRRYGIDGYYVPLGVAPEDFEAALRALPRLGFRGVNVTIPHKERALALADTVTERAAAIGAANTLTFGSKGEIEADNTDGYGFIANLRQNAVDWSADSGPAVVLGAGGAARGIVAALLAEGAPEIRLANRSIDRARLLAGHFGPCVSVITMREASAALAGAATLVNTTSLGMSGQPALEVDFTAAGPDLLVTDIVYTPLVTPLLARAAAHGLGIVDGLGMLLHQAAPGFERWFGIAPEVDDDLRAAVLEG